MKITARPGYCLISPDPLIERTGLIFHPTQLKAVPQTGLCLQHNISTSWDEVDLTNLRVVFDRWSGRPFRMWWKDGKEYEFVVVSQWAILGIIANEANVEEETEQ